MIGIIGAVGPYAGVELHRAILDNTEAVSDNEHIPVIHINDPRLMHDRTGFLMGNSPNPAPTVIKQLEFLSDAGCTVVGIPCNTLHSPEIFDPIRSAAHRLNINLINMVDETLKCYKNYKNTEFKYLLCHTVAVLCTLGAFKSGVFAKYAADHHKALIYPDDPEKIHDIIYNKFDGIKSRGQATPSALHYLHDTIKDLLKRSDAVILGCTELAMVLKGEYGTINTIDVLAKAMVREYLK